MDPATAKCVKASPASRQRTCGPGENNLVEAGIDGVVQQAAVKASQGRTEEFCGR